MEKFKSVGLDRHRLILRLSVHAGLEGCKGPRPIIAGVGAYISARYGKTKTLPGIFTGTQGLMKSQLRWRLLGLYLVFRANKIGPFGWSGTRFRVRDISVLVPWLSWRLRM